MSDAADIERPPTWWYWKTPAGVTAAFAGLAALSPGNVISLFPIWMLFMLAWMAWSIVSGLYPWSIRMSGEFR